jgi:DNA-directed RNA polymerase specialized sigma24 family protein
VYERYGGAVAAYQRLSGRGAAVDDVFLKLFRAPPPEPAELGVTIFTIARRSIHAEGRSAAAGAPRDDQLTRMCGQLTDDERDGLLLRIVARLSVAEIVRVIGAEEGTVRRLQREALERLAVSVAAQPSQPSQPPM